MKRIKVSYTDRDLEVDDFQNAIWNNARKIELNRYWSGMRAEKTRHAEARLIWSENAFYARFEGEQQEPLIIDSKPDTTKKTTDLWKRDVFEIFVAPDRHQPEKYFEFEAAPTGEWLDVKIEILPDGERCSDFEFDSGMQNAAAISGDKILTIIKINWQAFNKKPDENDVWRGNLFRCIGDGETRGYLSWQPTFSEIPNFHVPEVFGEFEFIKN